MEKLKKITLYTLCCFSSAQRFWMILFFGALVRVGFCWHVDLLSRDSLHYLTKIDMWMKGGNFKHVLNFDSGAFPLLGVKLSAGLWGDLPLVGIVFNLCVGTLLIPAVYFLLKCLHVSVLSANFGAFLIAFNPYLIRLSCEIQRENVYLLTGILWLLCLICGIREKNCWLVGAGFFLFLSCNSRYEAYEFFPITIVTILFSTMTLRRKLLSLCYCGIGLLFGLLLLTALGIPCSYMLEQGWSHLRERSMMILWGN